MTRKTASANQSSISVVSATSLHLNVYQANTKATDKVGELNKDAESIMLLGLFGEIGSLLSEMKKKKRDTVHAAYRQSITEEIGDVLWYLAAIARRNDLVLSDIASKACSNGERLPNL